MTQTEALKLALEALETLVRLAEHEGWEGFDKQYNAIKAIKEALAQPEHEKERCVGCDACIDTACGRDECPKGWPKAAQPEQEPVTVLPDGSAFAVMSYPLPKDHWLCAERQYECGADEPNELGKPILTHAVCDAVVSAVRYAIRGATNCGKELDFDPDALVQNAVYALCGPYGSPKPKEPEKEPMFTYEQVKAHIQAAMMSTTPPQRTWVGLTDEEINDLVHNHDDFDGLWEFTDAVEAKLKEKNVL